MIDLSGKSALVTGASRGIGEGIATGLAEYGADVAVNHPPVAAERENAAQVVAAIESTGSDAVSLEGDVSDEAEVRAMIDRFEAEFGRVDILVNNAGVNTTADLVDVSGADWDRLHDVNLRGVFHTTKHALPGMLGAASGKIVNVASQYGLMGAAGMVPYSASKGGVIAFTRALAREVAPDLTVNAVCPGLIETERIRGVYESWSDADREERIGRIPLGRIGQVEDVVPSVLFLSGEPSDFYTGQVLVPNGGEHMY